MLITISPIVPITLLLVLLRSKIKTQWLYNTTQIEYVSVCTETQPLIESNNKVNKVIITRDLRSKSES